MAVIVSLIITTVFGGKLIQFLHKKQVGETIRDLGLEGEKKKAGTPTMGGLIIIAGILIPTLLFAKLTNVYVILMIITTLWMGAIGFWMIILKCLDTIKKGSRVGLRLSVKLDSVSSSLVPCIFTLIL